jgi:hypothetical protein
LHGVFQAQDGFIQALAVTAYHPQGRKVFKMVSEFLQVDLGAGSGGLHDVSKARPQSG